MTIISIHNVQTNMAQGSWYCYKFCKTP